MFVYGRLDSNISRWSWLISESIVQSNAFSVLDYEDVWRA